MACLDPRSQRRDADDEQETTSRRGHGHRRRATLCWARVGRIADPVLALGTQRPVGFLDDVDDADGRHTRPGPRFPEPTLNATRSLGKAPFNPGTFLRIDTNDRQLPEVRQFKQEIQQILSYVLTPDNEQAENRFSILNQLVRR